MHKNHHWRSNGCDKNEIYSYYVYGNIKTLLMIISCMIVNINILATWGCDSTSTKKESGSDL